MEGLRRSLAPDLFREGRVSKAASWFTSSLAILVVIEEVLPDSDSDPFEPLLRIEVLYESDG